MCDVNDNKPYDRPTAAPAADKPNRTNPFIAYTRRAERNRSSPTTADPNETVHRLQQPNRTIPFIATKQ